MRASERHVVVQLTVRANSSLLLGSGHLVVIGHLVGNNYIPNAAVTPGLYYMFCFCSYIHLL